MPYGTGGYYPAGTGSFTYPPTSPTAQPPTYYQQQPQQTTMILVNSEQEASNWNVLPGNSLFFMDSNNKFFYIKSVELSGIASFRKFKFEEVPLNGAPENSDYITREEFEKRLSSFNKNQHKQQFQKKGEKIDG